MTTKLAAVAFGLALASGSTFALGQTRTSTSVTIYSNAAPGSISPDLYRPTPQMQRYGYQPQGQVPGYGVVRQDRPITLDQAVSEIRFVDVAALIDPTTVSFTCLTDPGTSVLEQNYQFDLVSSDKLLERFIDKEIGVTVLRGDKAETIRGILTSAAGGQLVLRTERGLEMVNGYSGVSFPALPEGLITRPTLIWKVGTQKPGAHTARVSYETQGITWWADYNLIFSEGDNANRGTLDVGAWVSIINQSGAGFTDATLKLVAGDVNRAPRSSPQGMYPAAREELALGAPDAGFREKSFFEYHLYTLGRPTTLPDNSTKQVELFPRAQGVPCEKVLVYDGLGQEWWWGGGEPMTDESFGSQTRKDIDVYLRFRNDRESGLGMPLPAGRVRVSKIDSDDGGVEFIGEDVIRHTPQGERVLIKLGRAFDVVGERRQTNFAVDHARRVMEESYEIKVRNRKKEPVEVIVQERPMRWSGWEITRKSQDFEKIDSRRVHFPLRLKPDEEGVVTYTVRYTW